MKSRDDLISELNCLIQHPGYIYTLCMIILNDLAWDFNEMQNSNAVERLCINELVLILGYIIKQPLDLSYPGSFEDIRNDKEETYKILEEIHYTFTEQSEMNLLDLIDGENDIGMNNRGKMDLNAESIFYGGEAIYDFQYIEHLNPKYIYDKDHLFKRFGYDLDSVPENLEEVKIIQESKRRRIHNNFYVDHLGEIKENNKNKTTSIDELDETTFMLFLYQFRDLFDAKAKDQKNIKCLCDNVLETLSIDPTEITNNEFSVFIQQYSLEPSFYLNTDFITIGDHNVFNEKPIIKLPNGKFFIPIIQSLLRSTYESPFYWLIEDPEYRNIAAKNRGTVGEEITYNILKSVFGEKNTYLSVLVKEGRNDTTDIDILCILDHYALIVQVKSKKLTELARMGNQDSFNKDFDSAIQSAFQQGLKSRDAILNGNAILYDSNGNLLKFTNDFKEIYIMCITTENVASLSFLVNSNLQFSKGEPFPLVLSIFDLEILAYYLKDPYDFIYYARQRTHYFEFIQAPNEICYLAFHLTDKLCDHPDVTHIALDQALAFYIDKDFIAQKFGISHNISKDAFSNRWKNDDFDRLCHEIKQLESDYKIDIIFRLLDLSGKSREAIVIQFIECKERTNRKLKASDVSIITDQIGIEKYGFSYVSTGPFDEIQLIERLDLLCSINKYRNRSDTWIGLGCYYTTKKLVDVAFYDFTPWLYDEEMEKLLQEYESSKHKLKQTNLKKVVRK